MASFILIRAGMARPDRMIVKESAYAV